MPKKLSNIELLAQPVSLNHIYPIRCLLLADLHCGSQSSIQPEKFETSDGRVITQNKVQAIIKKQWNNIVQVADEFKVQYVFVLGDLLQGLNPKEAGKYITCDIGDQVRMATQVISEIAKDRIIYIISGTRYHSIPRGMGDPEEEVALRLRDVGFKAEFLGDMTFIEIKGIQRERRIFMTHEASGGLISQANMMSRDIDWALQAESKGQVDKVDAIVRAHLHHWVHVDHSRIHAIQLPCFAGNISYNSTLRYYFKLQPDIGGATMLIDNRGRLRFWEFLMPQEDHLKMTREITKVQPISLPSYVSTYGLNKKCLL